jgi:hypothetical protein
LGDVEELWENTISEATSKVLGELLLVHGHQGTADSDRHARCSKFFVHRAWRPVQALLNRPWNTPSVDWRLRGEHASNMAAWAEDRRQVVIAGHTHLPVFFNQQKTPDPPPDTMAPTRAAARTSPRPCGAPARPGRRWRRCGSPATTRRP